MKIPAITATVIFALSTLANAQQEPVAKRLSAPEDPREKTVLVGRTEAAGVLIQFEIEPAKTMIMNMGDPPEQVKHAPKSDEVYHIEAKPIDPRSKTRIPYARTVFEAVKTDTGQTIKGELHPMWGSSGLHYAMNSALLGDGAYLATITINAPVFGRSVGDKDLFMVPAVAKFHFKLKEGALTEISEPSPLPN